MQNATTVTPRALVATATAATDYASFVRDGTREYKIPKIKRKRGQKMLHFYWPKAPEGAAWVFFPQVTHPKTAGNPWWNNAIARWPEMLREGLRRAPT